MGTIHTIWKEPKSNRFDGREIAAYSAYSKTCRFWSLNKIKMLVYFCTSKLNDVYNYTLLCKNYLIVSFLDFAYVYKPGRQAGSSQGMHSSPDIHSLTDPHTHSFNHPTLTHSPPDSLIHSLTPTVTHSLIDPNTQSPTHSLLTTLIHSLARSLTPILTHLFTHPHTHSHTPTLTHPPHLTNSQGQEHWPI